MCCPDVRSTSSPAGSASQGRCWGWPTWFVGLAIVVRRHRSRIRTVARTRGGVVVLIRPNLVKAAAYDEFDRLFLSSPATCRTSSVTLIGRQTAAMARRDVVVRRGPAGLSKTADGNQIDTGGRATSQCRGRCRRQIHRWVCGHVHSSDDTVLDLTFHSIASSLDPLIHSFW